MLERKAVVLVSEGKYEESIELFTESIAYNPAAYKSYSGRAVALAELRRFDEATADARKAVEMSPEAPIGHSTLGDILAKQGKFDEAIECYTKAIALDDTHWAAYLHRSRVHEHLGNEEAAEEDRIMAERFALSKEEQRKAVQRTKDRIRSSP